MLGIASDSSHLGHTTPLPHPEVGARELALPASLEAGFQAWALLLRHTWGRFWFGSWAMWGSQPSSEPTVCRGWWQRPTDLGARRWWRHTDGRGPGVPGIASAVKSCCFLSLFTLEGSQGSSENSQSRFPPSSQQKQICSGPSDHQVLGFRWESHHSCGSHSGTATPFKERGFLLLLSIPPPARH